MTESFSFLISTSSWSGLGFAHVSMLFHRQRHFYVILCNIHTGIKGFLNIRQ